MQGKSKFIILYAYVLVLQQQSYPHVRVWRLSSCVAYMVSLGRVVRLKNFQIHMTGIQISCQLLTSNPFIISEHRTTLLSVVPHHTGGASSTT